MRDISRVLNFYVTESNVGPDPAAGQVEWVYRRTDPFAVTMRFLEGPLWGFARDLLVAGLDGPVGEGDVLICPVSTDTTGRGVQVTLRSPKGRAVLEFNRKDVELFLRAAFRSVPRGHEHLYIDWDATITALLPKSEPKGDLR